MNEFIQTYGWAILASIIATLVLAYFNVFDPNRFGEDKPHFCIANGYEDYFINAYTIGATGFCYNLHNKTSTALIRDYIKIDGKYYWVERE